MENNSVDANTNKTEKKFSHGKSTLTFSFLTIISRITGLLKWILLSAALGLSRFQDAYNVAHVLPNMIYEFVLGGIFTAAFIPIFVPYLSDEEKKKEGWNIINILFSAILLWLGIISLLCSIFSSQLTYIQTILAKSHEDRVMAVYFFRFFAFQILLYGISSYFTGILNAYHKFAITAAAPIINNLVVILTLFIFIKFPQIGAEGLVIGTMLGVVMMAAVQLPQIIKLGWRPRFVFRLKDEVIINFLKLGIPVAGYVAINQIGFLVRTNLAYPYEGGFSALQIGFTFFNLPYGIFAVAVTTVIFPTLSKMALKEDWVEYRRIASKGFRWITLALFPSAILMFLLSKPAVTLLMQYGKFTGKDSDFLSRVISAYAIGIVPYGFFMFLTRIFYALKDTKTPMMINIFGVAFNIISNIIAVKYFGVEGIALMVGATYLLMCIFGFRILYKRVGAFERNTFSYPIIAVGVTSLISGIFIFIVKNLIHLSGSRHLVAAFTLIIPAAVGILIYFALIIFLKYFLLKKSEIKIF